MIMLLSYAELAENHVQDILDIDPTQQASKAEGSRPQFFGGQFFPLLDQAALQGIARVLQQLPLTGAGDQTTLPRPEERSGKFHQRRNQLRDPVTAPRRDGKVGSQLCWPLRRAPGVQRIEIDLVSYRPNRNRRSDRVVRIV